MNLKESARQWVLRNLPVNPNDADTIAHLSSLDASELLALFHNWMSRLISPRPRRVFKSSAFTQNTVANARTVEIAQIISDIENGRDLTKYLSRDVKIGAQDPGQKRRRDLDLMLNQWGVHHLHISTTIEADGFVKRDGPVIFAIFRPDKAYLIDVMNHGDWTPDHVLEVLVDEWPDVGLIHEIKGVEGLSHTVTENDRKVLRRKHVNAAFEYKGKVYMPDGMLSAAGTTYDAVREADRVVIELERFEERANSDPKWLRRLFQASGVQYPDNPKFEFEIREDGVGLFEATSGTWMPLLRAAT